MAAGRESGDRSARFLGSRSPGCPLPARLPTANVVAAWLDALATDPRFTDVWVSGLSSVPVPDGTAIMQFSAQMSLTGETLVLRPFGEESA